ncbi:cyclin-dependent kinase inhibitor 4-like isoform X3 [Primulina tabacum]|uniref:cyclin-dependent kinase inhibitor 4-like isoform X3 n=1 Tax=Primulina tabacum TaxID=48773 RepID=UPI003F5A45DB
MAEYYLQKRSEESTGAAEEEDMLLNFIKKRKLCSECELLENSVSSAASVACGCCADDDDDSSGGVTESVVVSPDLEVRNLEFREVSMAINCSRIDHESTPTSETRGDSEHSSLESTPHAACPQRISASSRTEIEEFFAAAEKYEQKRFAEKYNYDIAKDVPLEGKYEWVPLW